MKCQPDGGFSGCGKSSVGEKLAEALHLAFVEGDALHHAANVEKMSKGIPLTDEDRMPWLERIGEDIKASLEKG
ncbi:shikimate kinase, partial [Rhizobium ruizarguesonis]